jgi:metal-responsive CopG/Arc/MetJ family transcriptional regulator
MEPKTGIGRITVSLTPALLEAIGRLKARDSCSISAIVEIALRDYIGSDSEDEVGARLRAAGASRRRVLPRKITIFGGKKPRPRI